MGFVWLIACSYFVGFVADNPNTRRCRRADAECAAIQSGCHEHTSCKAAQSLRVVWHNWPISVDNEPAASDTYQTKEIYPTRGPDVGVGGRMRQRPVVRPVSSNASWKLRDMEDDVRRAKDIGLDCFVASVCGIGRLKKESAHCWDKLLLKLDAARNVGDFKIIPGIDAPSVKNQFTPAQAANEYAKIANHPSLWRTGDGRIYFVALIGDRYLGASWFRSFISEMKKRGHGVALISVLSDFNGHKDAFLPISDIMGLYRSGTAADILHTKNNAPWVKSRGKKFIAAVAPQNFRPKSRWYREVKNSENFRRTAMDAIENGGDWMLYISWNDRTEASEIAPSNGTQWAFFDLAAYYTTWFKMGSAPTIVRDVLYAFHRIHRTDAKPSKQSTTFKVNGAQSPANDIELVAFLKSPGGLRIDNGQKMHGRNAPAGVTSFRVPMANGNPAFRLWRNGQMLINFTSPFRIRTNIEYQDMLYRGMSNTRSVVDMPAQ
ncbi:MAG: hypothetical protein HC834_00410 [Rhodospirillales bacterium]|nr:hypothetical protein [Rhodospirillales bacterium]